MVNGVKFTFQQGAASVVVNSATSVTVTDNLAAMTTASSRGTSLYNAFVAAQSSGPAAAALSTVIALPINTPPFWFALVLVDVTPGVSTTTLSSSAGGEVVLNHQIGTAAVVVAGSAADNHGSLSLSSGSARKLGGFAKTSPP